VHLQLASRRYAVRSILADVLSGAATMSRARVQRPAAQQTRACGARRMTMCTGPARHRGRDLSRGQVIDGALVIAVGFTGLPPRPRKNHWNSHSPWLLWRRARS
jgi:hypothetical protein